MSRRADLRKFYSLMRRLERNISGRFKLGKCNAKIDLLKKFGVYFFFEDGERRSGSGNGDRVVRVGSHALNAGENTTLWDRISQHRGADQPGRRRSRTVFRNRVGNAICRRNRGLGPRRWPIDAELGDAVRIEKLINRHMWPMKLLVLPVGRRAHRVYIESNAIALLSEYREEKAIDAQSRRWLGRRCDREQVRESGLWQSKHVNDVYRPDFLDWLEEYVDRVGK